MARRANPRPTEAELEILQVLWKSGPSTVRQVHEILGKTRSTGYTTTLKLMQIMVEKGLLLRDESSRTHVYRVKVSQEKAQRELIRNLLSQAFGGSTKSLIMQALSAKASSAEDLAEIRGLLDELEGEKP